MQNSETLHQWFPCNTARFQLHTSSTLSLKSSHHYYLNGVFSTYRGLSVDKLLWLENAIAFLGIIILPEWLHILVHRH